MWFWLRNGSGTCGLMNKKDILDLTITYGVNSDENEMGTIIGTEGQATVRTPQTQSVTTEEFHQLIYSYTHFNGEKTDASYYIDGNLVKQETLEDRIIIDDIRSPAYIGGKYDSVGRNPECPNLVNKCDGSIYDLVLTQAEFNSDRNRVIPGQEPYFWEVAQKEFIDYNGDIQDCDSSCIYGCVDAAVCDIEFGDD